MIRSARELIFGPWWAADAAPATLGWDATFADAEDAGPPPSEREDGDPGPGDRDAGVPPPPSDREDGEPPVPDASTTARCEPLELLSVSVMPSWLVRAPRRPVDLGPPTVPNEPEWLPEKLPEWLPETAADGLPAEAVVRPETSAGTFFSGLLAGAGEVAEAGADGADGAGSSEGAGLAAGADLSGADLSGADLSEGEAAAGVVTLPSGSSCAGLSAGPAWPT